MADLTAGYPVLIELPVAWGEMDAFRHVNNVVYFRYFESARLEYLRRAGWLEVQEQTGVGVILASVQARFRKPLTYPDTILVGARVATVGEDRFTMEHVVVSRKLGAVATEGHGVIVTYDYHQHRKVPVPEELRRRITDLEAGAGHLFDHPAT